MLNNKVENQDLFIKRDVFHLQVIAREISITTLIIAVAKASGG